MVKLKKNNKTLFWIGIIFIVTIIGLLFIISYEHKNDNSDILISKNNNNNILFKKYLIRDNWTVYLANSLNEYYLYDIEEDRITLKEYSKTYQEFNEIIKDMIIDLKYYDTLKYDNYEMYKSEYRNISLIVCNNKKIFIGPFNINYDKNIMCI